MKRSLGFACALCLLLTAAAPARIASYSGAAGFGTVSFNANLVVKKGKCRKRNRRGRCVKRGKRRMTVVAIQPGMVFAELPLHCEDGDFTIRITQRQRIAVANGQFTSGGPGTQGGAVSIIGKFAPGGVSASGTVRDSGTIDRHDGCDTGIVSWSAR